MTRRLYFAKSTPNRRLEFAVWISLSISYRTCCKTDRSSGYQSYKFWNLGSDSLKSRRKRRQRRSGWWRRWRRGRRGCGVTLRRALRGLNFTRPLTGMGKFLLKINLVTVTLRLGIWNLRFFSYNYNNKDHVQEVNLFLTQLQNHE